jgi:hypothetical protein
MDIYFDYFLMKIIIKGKLRIHGNKLTSLGNNE